MANLVYIAPATPITWTDDTTGGTYTLDIGGLAAGSVRNGDQGDLGAGDRADYYDWSMVVDGFDTAPVVGEEIHLYLAFGRGTTDIDGDLGATDAASSTVVLPNLLHIGTLVVQTTTAANELRTSGRVYITHRYVTPVLYNATADALLSTSDAHTFTLTPVPFEIQ